MGKHIRDFRQGDTKVIRVKRETVDDQGAVTPVDLTGCRFTLSLTEAFDEQPVITWSKLAGDHVADDPVNGKIFIELSSEITRLIPPGKFYYDVQEETAEGVVTTVLPPLEDYKDRVHVIPDISDEI